MNWSSLWTKPLSNRQRMTSKSRCQVPCHSCLHTWGTCSGSCTLGLGPCIETNIKLPSKGSFLLIWSGNFCLLLIFIEPHTGKSRWTFQVSCSLPLLLWLSFLLSWSLCNPTPVSKVFVLLFCSWARLPFSYLPTFHSQDSNCIFLCLHTIVYKYIDIEMHLRNVWKCSFMF